MGFFKEKKKHYQHGPSSSENPSDGATSNKEENELLNPDGGTPGRTSEERRTHAQLHRDQGGSSTVPIGNDALGTGQNTLVNPGGFDPAEAMPARRNYTVSQVPMPPFTKLGNPGPLGLLSFALTTFALGLYECGAGLPHSNPQSGVGPNQAVFGLAIFMGGFAQFVAGIFEFRVGNTFGSTVHCSYGAFWLSYAMFLIPSLDIKGAYKGDKTAYSFGLGIYLILWCFLSFLFFIAALRTNITILLVLFFLVVALLLLSIANFISTQVPSRSVRVNKAGGAFTVVSAFFAFYAGASGLMVKDTTFVKFPLGEIPISSSTTSRA